MLVFGVTEMQGACKGKVGEKQIRDGGPGVHAGRSSWRQPSVTCLRLSSFAALSSSPPAGEAPPEVCGFHSSAPHPSSEQCHRANPTVEFGASTQGAHGQLPSPMLSLHLVPATCVPSVKTVPTWDSPRA